MVNSIEKPPTLNPFDKEKELVAMSEVCCYVHFVLNQPQFRSFGQILAVV